MKLRHYYFIEDDAYGQHGSFIQEIDITLKQYREVVNTRMFNGKRGFITKEYISALYYIQD